MTSTEAADIVDAIAQAVRANPAQFHLSITVAGQRITSYGGTGLAISVTGGGPGSTTIGQRISVGGADVEISQQRGVQAFDQQLGSLLQVLAQISQGLRSPTPDSTLVRRLVDSLKNTWVPGVIVGVVSAAVSKSIGI